MTQEKIKLSQELNQEQILHTAGVIQKIRPSYGPLIDFYKEVFMAQAAARSSICLDPIIIPVDLLALKQDNEMPLINPNQFTIDLDQTKKLLEKICSLAVAHAPKLAQAGEDLGIHLSKNSVDLKVLFSALLDSQDIGDMAKKLSISVENLSFFGFSAMTPSIQACSAQLASYLTDSTPVKKGYCPICGSQPDLAFFDKDGKKHVSCGLCSHEWQIQRMGCVFCDSTDKEDQHYFFSTEEKEFRVYMCDHCKNYIKAVDLRQMTRQFFPKLEQVTTLHLDIKAQEQGYSSAGGGSDLNE